MVASLLSSMVLNKAGRAVRARQSPLPKWRCKSKFQHDIMCARANDANMFGFGRFSVGYTQAGKDHSPFTERLGCYVSLVEISCIGALCSSSMPWNLSRLGEGDKVVDVNPMLNTDHLRTNTFC